MRQEKAENMLLNPIPCVNSNSLSHVIEETLQYIPKTYFIGRNPTKGRLRPLIL